MAAFGSRSRTRLLTCHADLRLVCEAVIEYYDFTIIWGFRDELAQNDAFSRGTSTKQFPNSKHNVHPSNAVDLAPWHADKPNIRWGNENEFIQLSGRMLQVADDMQIPMRWGGDWDMDDDLYDRNKPFDLGHFELF